HEVGHDHRRPDAVARRRASGQRTARENVADLVDDGSFVEYAPLVIAAQRRRRSLEELIARTPADGLVGGIGTVDGEPVIAMSYDYALLGCCDVIIATEGSNIGMGGPAMIEGGGLGVYEPTAIGPTDVQTTSGVIDVLVPDEAAAVAVAKQYVAYFRGAVGEWECIDQ